MKTSVKIVAFGAHPDDVELGCGGTLHKMAAAGHAVGIVDLTEGEMGTRGTVSERREESANAARILQAAWRENLQIPDANIRVNDENRRKVIALIRKFQPQLVFLPYEKDRHPDHSHTSKLVTEGCFYAGVKKLHPDLGPAFRPRRLVFYQMTYEFEPAFVVNISENFATKLAAIKAHRSQFHNPEYGGEETFISSKAYFESIEFRARHYGWQGGVTYAEPFWVRERLVLDDPLSSLATNHM